MFVVEKNLSYIDYSDKKLLSILKSSNQPLIAAADRPAEPTESYICSFQNKDKKIETYIMLLLIKSRIRVFYGNEKGEFLPDEFNEVEADALEFMESMGFTMDNIGFQKLKEDERQKLFNDLPIFISPENLEKPDSDAEEADYISASDLSEGLEEVLSSEDLEDIEEPAIGDKKPDLLDDDVFDKLDQAVANLGEQPDSTKADQPEENIHQTEFDVKTDMEAKEVPQPKTPQTMAATAGIGENDLSKIARIISSF